MVLFSQEPQFDWCFIKPFLKVPTGLIVLIDWFDFSFRFLSNQSINYQTIKVV
jgi:hypothetical protein